MSLLSKIQSTLGGGVLSPQGMGTSFRYGPGGAPQVNPNSAGILSQVLSGAQSARTKMESDEERRIKEAEEQKERLAILEGLANMQPQAMEYGQNVVGQNPLGGVLTIPDESGVHTDGSFVPENEREQAILAAVDEAVNKYVASGDIPPEDAAKVKAYQLAIAETESGMGRNNLGPRIGIDIEGDSSHYGERAQGPFQFMPSTAQSYGLKDPMDIKASADASVRHMLNAYKQKGDWRKAAIAHHSGPYYKKLGKWGKDYANKLDKRVGKYYS